MGSEMCIRDSYTGVSFVYHFSGIFASGLTPLIMSWLLIKGGGQPWLICCYILGVSLISTLCVALMRSTPAGQSDQEPDYVATPGGQVIPAE